MLCCTCLEKWLLNGMLCEHLYELSIKQCTNTHAFLPCIRFSVISSFGRKLARIDNKQKFAQVLEMLHDHVAASCKTHQ